MLRHIRQQLQKQQGFTLVELVVVIAIIGILAAIAVPKFTSATESARGAKIQADLRTIDSAIALVTAETGATPTSVALTAADAPNVVAKLASIPTPGTAGAKFKANGTVYTLGAAAYKIDANGRAVVTTEAGEGSADKNVNEL